MLLIKILLNFNSIKIKNLSKLSKHKYSILVKHPVSSSQNLTLNALFQAPYKFLVLSVTQISNQEYIDHQDTQAQSMQ
jgi:hypothetical protein